MLYCAVLYSGALYYMHAIVKLRTLSHLTTLTPSSDGDNLLVMQSKSSGENLLWLSLLYNSGMVMLSKYFRSTSEYGSTYLKTLNNIVPASCIGIQPCGFFHPLYALW